MSMHGGRVTSLSVIVAIHGSQRAARSDWDAFEFAAESSRRELIDAAVIERTSDRVERFISHSAFGWGEGIIASAIVATLWPPAMVTGALAGSIGGRVMTVVNGGLSYEAKSELGRVFQSGPFVAIGIADRGGAAAIGQLGARALRVGSLPMVGTARDLRRAFDTDASEDEDEESHRDLDG